MEDRLQPLARCAPDNRRFPVVSTVCTHRMSDCQLAGSQPRSGSRPRRLSPHTPGAGENGVETAANRECGVTPQPLCELPAPLLTWSRSAEGAGQIERHLLAQHVITDPRQFVCHGLERH